MPPRACVHLELCSCTILEVAVALYSLFAAFHISKEATAAQPVIDALHRCEPDPTQRVQVEMGMSVTILFLAASFKLAGFSDELIGDFQGDVQVPQIQPVCRAHDRYGM